MNMLSTIRLKVKAIANFFLNLLQEWVSCVCVRTYASPALITRMKNAESLVRGRTHAWCLIFLQNRAILRALRTRLTAQQKKMSERRIRLLKWSTDDKSQYTVVRVRYVDHYKSHSYTLTNSPKRSCDLIARDYTTILR